MNINHNNNITEYEIQIEYLILYDNDAVELDVIGTVSTEIVEHTNDLVAKSKIYQH